MKALTNAVGVCAAALGALAAGLPIEIVKAQGAEELEEVVVTGSRIRRDPLNEATAVMELSAGDIQESGLTNLGDALQNLPIAGSAINSQFNVPGNSGFPQDGSGIGAGAVEVSLRNVGSKRTLVLVDGKRWVSGASASGVRVHTLPTKPKDIEDDGLFHYAVLLPSAASESGKPSAEV